MKYIPKSLTTAIGRSALKAQKHSPTLLFAGGVVGMIATTVLASKATLRLEEVVGTTHDDLELVKLQHAETPDDYTVKDMRHDQVLLYRRSVVGLVKLYAPAAVMGVASIAMLTKSHSMLLKRNAALTAAYVAMEQSFNSYRDRIKEELGEDREREIYFDAQEITVTDEKGKETNKKVATAGYSPYARIFDETNKNHQVSHEANVIFLECQERFANHLLNSRGYVFLNEVYEALGMEWSEAGQLIGWRKNNPNGNRYIDFGLSADNERVRDFMQGYEKAIVLDFNVDPGTLYDNFTKID